VRRLADALAGALAMLLLGILIGLTFASSITLVARCAP
jgi:F0F1-type ATP synthase membrane subunit c/vacuolar-type H+-ATPase subunit K